LHALRADVTYLHSQMLDKADECCTAVNFARDSSLTCYGKQAAQQCDDNQAAQQLRINSGYSPISGVSDLAPLNSPRNGLVGEVADGWTAEMERASLERPVMQEVRAAIWAAQGALVWAHSNDRQDRRGGDDGAGGEGATQSCTCDDLGSADPSDDPGCHAASCLHVLVRHGAVRRVLDSPPLLPPPPPRPLEPLSATPAAVGLLEGEGDGSDSRSGGCEGGAGGKGGGKGGSGEDGPARRRRSSQAHVDAREALWLLDRAMRASSAGRPARHSRGEPGAGDRGGGGGDDDDDDDDERAPRIFWGGGGVGDGEILEEADGRRAAPPQPRRAGSLPRLRPSSPETITLETLRLRPRGWSMPRS
jgi:hypothetical protein